MDPFPHSLKEPEKVLNLPDERMSYEPLMTVKHKYDAFLLARRAESALENVSNISSQMIGWGEENETLTSRMMLGLASVEWSMHSLRNVLKELSVWKQALEMLKKLEALQDERDALVRQLREMGCEVYFRTPQGKGQGEKRENEED